MRKFDIKRQLVDTALQFYTRVEKRGLPLEASKALLNLSRNRVSRDTANSILSKVKENLSLWIGDTSLVQVCKRYINYLIDKDKLSLAECSSPFVLTSSWEVFRGYLFEDLKSFFGEADLENSLEERTPEGRFSRLLETIKLRGLKRLSVASHLAYITDPYTFTPLTVKMLKTLKIKDRDAYMRFNSYVRSIGLRPLEAFALLHMTLEETPSKERAIDTLLGINREKELLREAEQLWNAGRFYEAHEVLEEVWSLSSDRKKREAYQGVIRVAIALHHYSSGEKERSLKVLKKALTQLKEGRLDLNLEEIASWTEEAIRKLQRGDELQKPPTLRVI